MAQKRMFSLSVVDTDKFLEMPVSARLLYYELGMRADDDGFVDNYKKILMFTGLKEDDLKLLIAKQFIIPFESGIIVIKHWRLNNYLQKDRIKHTIHQNELKQLQVDENNVYNLYTSCIHSIEENRLEENSIEYIVEDNKAFIKEIVNYLNEKLKTNYKTTTQNTIKHIKARLNEGYKVNDFKLVIDKMYDEWYGTEMQKYLRPETLFGTKFESYLNHETFKKQTNQEKLDDLFKKMEEKYDNSRNE